jgi:hypothetical protein
MSSLHRAKERDSEKCPERINDSSVGKESMNKMLKDFVKTIAFSVESRIQGANKAARLKPLTS